MITAFLNKPHSIENPAKASAQLQAASWLDAVAPTSEEVSALEALLETAIPSRDQVSEIEATSRLFAHDDVAFITLSHIIDVEAGRPQLTPATFILKRDRLVTLRDRDSRAFNAFRNQWTDDYHKKKPSAILSELLNVIIERAADVIEETQTNVNTISEQLLVEKKKPVTSLSDVVRSIGLHQIKAALVQESLIELERALSFINSLPMDRFPLATDKMWKSVARDCRSLQEHTNFITANLGFLLQAAQGLINERQNDTIKLLSIISILFLPPTLLASIYGMNFSQMPGLQHELGFPIAVLAMLASSVAPLILAKRWRWL
ncbi:CorA family divalent cation transporter [Hyphococcus sp.]|uniref:CorA family divalent cation transporter n=1 Tax=Hyphococcus sp. TaxID=2038636 RepID=UPI003D0B4ED9